MTLSNRLAGGVVVLASLSVGFALPMRARDTLTSPVGPQIRAAAGIGSALTLRDIVIDDGFSPWTSLSLSYRGFSISGWGSATSRQRRPAQVAEAFVAYSHKAPYVDVHAGLVRTSVRAPGLRALSTVRLVASSNTSVRTIADVGIDCEIGGGSGTVVSAALAHSFANVRRWSVDGRVSSTFWDSDPDTARGWSARLLATRPLRGATRASLYLGYDRTNIHASSRRSSRGSLIAGVSVAFR